MRIKNRIKDGNVGASIEIFKFVKKINVCQCEGENLTIIMVGLFRVNIKRV